MSDSIATRVDALTADGYRIVKFLNYDDGDFSKIIRKVENHFDEFEFKLMENVTHLPFGGGRSFTLVGVKVKEGNDQSAWQMNNLLPGGLPIATSTPYALRSSAVKDVMLL